MPLRRPRGDRRVRQREHRPPPAARRLRATTVAFSVTHAYSNPNSNPSPNPNPNPNPNASPHPHQASMMAATSINARCPPELTAELTADEVLAILAQVKQAA